MKFKIDSQYQPSGDQPSAIKGICNALNQGVDAVTFAIVKVFPEPVTPSSVTASTPSFSASHIPLIAAGWSPEGLYSESILNFAIFSCENIVLRFAKLKNLTFSVSEILLSLRDFKRNTFYKTIVLLWFIHTKCSRCAA